jgi:MFS family permease
MPQATAFYAIIKSLQPEKSKQNQFVMDNQEASLPAGAKSKFFYGYIIVIAAFIIQLLMFGPRSSFGVFFKPMIAEFGWTRALLSGAFSMSSILQGFFGIVMGSLNDRLGPRVVMTLCGFLTGLGFMLMSQISAAWQLYLFYVVLIGIGMGGIYIPTMSTVARWFVKRRSVMTGLVIAGGGVGGLILPPVVNWLISTYGWRNAYIILGALILVIIILAAQFLRRDPTQMGLVPYGKNKAEQQELNFGIGGFSLKEAAGTIQFWMALVMLFCFGFCVLTITVHIVPHTTDLGIAAAAAANTLAVLNGVQLVGSIVLGGAADRIGNRQAYIICFILISAMLFWLLLIKETWMFYLFAAVMALGGGGGATLTSPLVAELFGMRSHGLILGVIIFCATMGGAAGPFIAGYIFDVSGSYQLAFLISAALGVVGLILAATLRPVKNLNLETY